MAKPRITIVGLGLVGGSLGLALQKVKTDFEIVGHDKDPGIAGRAKKVGAVDQVEWNLIAACDHASIIFLATPILAVRDTLALIAQDLRPGTIVTDTATTKQQVLRWAEEILPPGVSFIGGDPLIGAPQPGLDGASAGLFANATYCLIPLPAAQPESVQLLADLVTLIGARPFFVDAVEHDGLMAGVAHLPFVVSAALLRAASSSAAWQEMARMASYEFRQVTSPSDVDPAIPHDIALTNKAGLLRWIDAAIDSLGVLRVAIASEDSGQIEQVFAVVQAARTELLRGVQPANPAAEEMDRIEKNRLRQMFLGSGGRRP